MIPPAAHADTELVHYLKNQFTIILGFTELLAEAFAGEAAVRQDLDEIRKAAAAALARMPELSARLSRGA